ncbi:MAG: iron-sulfur cluster assembly accessory protein [Candidatus Marinimicrobia bacterium]|nr:iron-sulfur cluster assembly accessory protein [Candidatus Neomarinimicrobiota bacterium]
MAQANILNETITIETKAAKRLKVVMGAEGKADFALRMSVVGGGCSGMTYNMSFDDKQGEFDKVFESEGVKIFCDLKSWLYLKGTKIDYSDDMLTGGFKINNPNASRTCGCGTSFSA